MEPAFKQKYRKPEGGMIEHTPQTERLYELERLRDAAFRAAAEELGKVMRFEHFWQEALPEAILSFLEGWDNEAAKPAAEAYLEKLKERGI